MTIVTFTKKKTLTTNILTNYSNKLKLQVLFLVVCKLWQNEKVFAKGWKNKRTKER